MQFYIAKLNIINASTLKKWQVTMLNYYEKHPNFLHILKIMMI